MQYRNLGIIAGGLILGGVGLAWADHQSRALVAQPVAQPVAQRPALCNPANPTTRTQEFLVVGGGGIPEMNEISLEKNLLYFQRTLQQLRYNPAQALFYFANGTDGQATVRYLDPQGKERFKVPQIPHLLGGSTRANVTTALRGIGQRAPQQALLYFTGHGNRNPSDLNNNTFNLWPNDDITVQQFSQLLDQLPNQTAVIVVMAQCFSGSFANVIYQGGRPGNGLGNGLGDRLAPQTRCGFFATVKERPSVGCTPAVDEADYEDYSSSFFAGLSGQNRVGKPVASADYNQDGRVSYREAHAFVKIDAQTTDLPVSSAEVWLQVWAKRHNLTNPMIEQPIAKILATARPEQQAVVRELLQQLGLNTQASLSDQWPQMQRLQNDEVKSTYGGRLVLELVNIASEQHVRQSQNAEAIATLERILKCEDRGL
jgi:hypothetical protein